MNARLVEFVKSLLSRKFLLALSAFLAAVANGEWTAAVTIVLGYLGVEGGADFIERARKAPALPAGVDTLDGDDEPDKTRVIAGGDLESEE